MKPNKPLPYRGLASLLLVFPNAAEPQQEGLAAEMAKLFEHIMVCTWSPGPYFLSVIPSPTCLALMWSFGPAARQEQLLLFSTQKRAGARLSLLSSKLFFPEHFWVF